MRHPRSTRTELTPARESTARCPSSWAAIVAHRVRTAASTNPVASGSSKGKPAPSAKGQSKPAQAGKHDGGKGKGNDAGKASKGKGNEGNKGNGKGG